MEIGKILWDLYYDAEPILAILGVVLIVKIVHDIWHETRLKKIKETESKN